MIPEKYADMADNHHASWERFSSNSLTEKKLSIPVTSCGKKDHWVEKRDAITGEYKLSVK